MTFHSPRHRPASTLIPKGVGIVGPVLVGLALAGCAQTELGARDKDEAVKTVVAGEAKKAQRSVQSVQSAVMKGGKLEGGDAQGKPLWRLEAKQIQVAGAVEDGVPNHATLTDARATLFRSGKIEARLQSKQIQMFKTAAGIRLVLTGEVKARSEALASGDQGPVEVDAARADVDVNKRLIAASGGVLVTHQKVKVRAQTMRGQTSLQVVDLVGNVQAQDTSGVQMRAKQARYNWQRDQLSAQTVSATREDVVLTGAALEANTTLERGSLRGNVSAKSPRGVATGPRVDFDWKRDIITAPNSTFKSPDGVLSAATLRTDSKLRLSNATGLKIEKDGATLQAREATGLDSLKKLTGVGVTVQREGATLTAGRAQSENWSDKNGKIVATGGVTVKNAQGTARAAQAIWTGGTSGTIKATGGVEIRSDGGVLKGAQGQSDTKFQHATLSGDVNARLKDGSTLNAPILVKTGEQVVAPRGALGKFQSGGELGVLTMRAARMESNLKASTATGSGGVTITSATGASVQAKSATYSKATQKITAKGEVVVRDPARGLTQRGNKMVADLRLKQVILEDVQGKGSAQLFDGKNLFD